MPGNYGPRGEDGTSGLGGIDGLPGLAGTKGNRGDPGSAILFGEMGVDGEEGRFHTFELLTLDYQIVTYLVDQVILENQATKVILVKLD